jgi:hypothetical protein
VPALARLGVLIHARYAEIHPLDPAARPGRLLVALGTDPRFRDTDVDSPPQGWAEHNHRHGAAAHLAGLPTG